LEEFWELDAEPVTILEELVFILGIKLVPIFSGFGVICLDELLGHWVQTLTRNLFLCMLHLFVAPCGMVPVDGEV